MSDFLDWSTAPLRPVALAQRSIRQEKRPDGTLLLRSEVSLGRVEALMGNYLIHWAAKAPDRPFLCQRIGPWDPHGAERPWRTLTYGQALRQSRSVAQYLIDRGMHQGTPLLVLSGNSIEHAVLMLGGFLAGVPVAPISQAYSLLGDLSKLRVICELIRPTMVFAQDATPFERALRQVAALLAKAPELVTADRGDVGLALTEWSALIETRPTAAVDDRHAALTPDTVAKILFTSGSTGHPKGVPNTHLMMSSNQAMMAAVVPPDAALAPVFVDWMPWSHTFGGNVVLDWILRDGGTLYLDGGRPVEGGFAETLSNLRVVSPTHYFNVPAGYAMLVDALSGDAGLRERFFGALRLCYYGGSGLPQSTWDQLQTLSVRTTGQRFAFTTGCGSTETGPIATFLHWSVERAGIVGLPLPGVALKLVPTAGRYEMRLRGDNIFKGYIDQPALTVAAFDEEGFFRTGDAVRLVNDEDVSFGLAYEGRIVEDFKLATGTFVAVGLVRLAVLSAVPLLRDAVLAGPDRPWLGLLGWINEDACRALVGDPSLSSAQLVTEARVWQAISLQLEAYNAQAVGGSRVIRAFCLLQGAPSIAEGEITEKGYVNQKAVLANRAAEVSALYEDALSPGSQPSMRNANSA